MLRPYRGTDAATSIAAELALAAGRFAAALFTPTLYRRGRRLPDGLGAAAHGAEVAGLDAGAAQRVAAHEPGGALGLAALLELVHACRPAVLHLAREPRAAEDGGARQLGLRRLGDARGLAVDHLAPVLAPDIGARDVAAAGEAAAAEDGVRDGAEGGGEEEKGFYHGRHWEGLLDEYVRLCVW
ncbi:hypothetical protein PG994_006018 [Apiospora phragmitis]|uniref:Uncharacterized protein n=1 Tax=Apiospora phragmitis TaxID=2905665 RepID=A0ABR1VDZ4_9PEZI